MSHHPDHAAERFEAYVSALDDEVRAAMASDPELSESAGT
jgi:hypothetical protein